MSSNGHIVRFNLNFSILTEFDLNSNRYMQSLFMMTYCLLRRRSVENDGICIVIESTDSIPFIGTAHRNLFGILKKETILFYPLGLAPEIRL